MLAFALRAGLPRALARVLPQTAGGERHFHRHRAARRPHHKKLAGNKQLGRGIKPQQAGLIAGGKGMGLQGCPQIIAAIQIAHSTHKNQTFWREHLYGVIQHPAQIIVAGKAIHNAVEHHKIKMLI